MAKRKRYILIQIIPDDSSQTWTIRLRYRFLEFLFYSAIVALFAIGFAALKITEINGKVLTAEHLARTNRALLEKQKKMQLLDQELAHILQQEQAIRAMVQTFAPGVDNDSLAQNAGNNPGLLSKDYLNRYVSQVRDLERQNAGGRMSGSAIPDIWPVIGIISQGFRPGRAGWSEGHPGVDIVAESNALVASAAAGMVIRSEWDRDLGKYVRIDHGRFQTVYGHLARATVQVGDRVEKGGAIGVVGNTGNSQGPHLHYEIYRDGRAVDPRTILK